jgi:hypothetical protein
MPYNLITPEEDILDLPLAFSNYHKHKFLFIGAGEEEGDTLFVFVGGQSGEIYNFSVSKDAIVTLRGLQASGATIDVFLNTV